MKASISTYYTLIGIDKEGVDEYEILFGDYWRDVVEAERDEYREQGEYKSLVIIKSGAQQFEINAAVEAAQQRRNG